LKIHRKDFTKHDAAMLGAPTLARLYGKAAEHAGAQRRWIALDPSAATEVGIGQGAVTDGTDD
jgi:hypothetical protein